MNNILAAKVLMSYHSKISDGAYRTATEIAIETLFDDAISEWEKHYRKKGVTVLDYLGISQEQYKYWVLGIRQ